MQDQNKKDKFDAKANIKRMYPSSFLSPKMTRASPLATEKQILLEAPINSTFSSLSLENLETWDLRLDYPKPSNYARHPVSSTPTDDTVVIPFTPIPLSPVKTVESDEYYKPILRQCSSSSHSIHRPLPSRYPGETYGPRPIRGPAPFGPTKWKLFKRKTCPDLLKTRSTDNLFR